MQAQSANGSGREPSEPSPMMSSTLPPLDRRRRSVTRRFIGGVIDHLAFMKNSVAIRGIGEPFRLSLDVKNLS